MLRGHRCGFWCRLFCRLGLHRWEWPGAACECCGADDSLFDGVSR
jgi:hypothetical protein